MKKYKISNVHCQNCVRKIKNIFAEYDYEASISDDFKELSANGINDDIISELEEEGFCIKEI